TAKNLELAKQSILAKSPALAYQQEVYDEQFKRDLKVSSQVLEVTVAGSSIHAFTARSFERVSGPFSWDATIYYESLLKKDPGGNWKLHDINEYDMEYLVSDELLDAKPNVPENIQKAISETIDTQYKGFNDEDGPLLMSVIHPESSFYDIFKTSIDEGIFDEVNFNLKAEVIRTIFHQGDDAVLYIEEVDDADGDMFYSTSLYWLKQSGGKWLIYDVLELDIL
ncbi:copper amine oxidase N-terminal domain-containing protein, partial [Peribacillus sp. NPDC056705]